MTNKRRLITDENNFQIVEGELLEVSTGEEIAFPRRSNHVRSETKTKPKTKD